jgi:hypothetical protein
VSSSANTPGEPPPDDFYDAAPLEPHLLYQGEILVGVPILNMPKPSPWQLLRTYRTGRRIHEALQHGNLGGTVKVLDANLSVEQWYADGLGDYAMAVLDKRPAVVLSQTCDLQSKDFVQVAPIFPAQTEGAHLARLQNWEIFSAFWIRAHPPEIPEESFADLELVQAVHKTYIRGIAPGQHLRMSASRARLLQRSITRYFGRPNSFDAHSDHAPTAGTYLCVRCFYMDGVAAAVDLPEGADFPVCAGCNGTQWVLQGH